MADQVFNQELSNGNCDVVDTMLADGYKPNPNSIVVVCENGDIDMLTRLLNHPMELQLGFYTAVQHGHSHLLDKLFLAGANIHQADDKQNTSLHMTEDIETCKWLLDMGVMQTFNWIGLLPIHKACDKNLVELVGLQLKYTNNFIDKFEFLDKTDKFEFLDKNNSLSEHNRPNKGNCLVNQTDKNGVSLMSYACINGNIEMVKLLLQFPNIQLTSQTLFGKSTALHRAARHGFTKIVKLLLQTNDNPSSSSCSSSSNSSSNSNSSGSGYSFEKNCKFDICGDEKDGYGHTALYYACRHGHVDIVRFLLQKPWIAACINDRDHWGENILSRVCVFGNFEIVKLLLEHGSQQYPDEYGKTPLSKTCTLESPDIGKLLLEYGAE